MTPTEFTKEVTNIVFFEKEGKLFRNKDLEFIHSQLDDLMVQVLIELGYVEGIDILRSVVRWYA